MQSSSWERERGGSVQNVFKQWQGEEERDGVKGNCKILFSSIKFWFKGFLVELTWRQQATENNWSCRTVC